MERSQRIIVVGGNAAGMSAASAAKRINKSAEVIVLEKDGYISYATCSLPYFISGDVKDFEQLIVLTPDVAEKERGIKVLLHKEVIDIDVEKGKVSVKDHNDGKEEEYGFDTLVLALGASPIRPDVPGIDSEGIFTIRTLKDGLMIKEFIEKTRPKDAVIVGGGYIGIEMSESLRKRGINVTIVEKMDRILGTMEEEITQSVEEILKKHNVRILKNTSLFGFGTMNKRVTSVITDAEEILTDMVILAIGVKPNSEIALRAGITLGTANAIAVDENTRTNIENVFAAGDCAESFHLVTGKKVYIPLGTTANRQGRIAGENASGKRSLFKGVLGTAMTKVFELEVARTGISSIEAQREGIDFIKVTITGSSRSRAYPAGKTIRITYIVDKKTGLLLGAQMVGEEGVALRIDTLASCIHNRMTVHDVASIDLGYAPPFATVWDPILIAANEAIKRL
ncbi:MAG: FAD-dependent oxidoreductase [Desulfobacterota bacterium]|nr:FAD-dependent oxidoreductase [Thermodesulfobacteriota bacterium]